MNQCNLCNDVKIIFSDIDGTLLNHQKEINPKTIQVLQALSQKGFPICLITGRAFSEELDKIIKKIGVVDYLVTCGGAFLTNIKTNETIVIGTPISQDVVKWMINLARSNHRGLILGTANKHVYNFYFGIDEKTEIKDKEYFSGGTEVLQYDDPQMIDEILSKYPAVHIVYKAEADLVLKYSEEASQLVRHSGDSIAIVGNCFIEVEGKNTNKATGIKYLLNHYHLTTDNAIFFGDSANDIPAFELCKYSCQLGDRSQKLSELATFKLGDPNSSVIGDFLEKNILEQIK